MVTNYQLNTTIQKNLHEIEKQIFMASTHITKDGSTLEPSPHQSRIFEWALTGRGSAVITAVAGAGKTTTITWLANLIPVSQSCNFVAFNRSIVQELSARLPKHIRATTLNGLGFGTWLRFLGKEAKPELDPKKTLNIMRRIFSPEQMEEFGAALPKLVALGKGAGIVPETLRQGTGPRSTGTGALIGLTRDTDEAWIALIEHYDVDVEDTLTAIDLARRVLAETILTGKTVMDYDDQLYLPVIFNVRFWQNDWLFVDEAQDVNKIQRAMLKRALRPGGRLVAVGDACQPAGTLVETADCGKVPIEKLEVGQRVISYRKQYSTYRTRPISGITVRNFSGKLFTTLGTSYTENHFCLANFENLKHHFVVYAMRKNGQFRIGACKFSYSQGIGPMTRLKQELADDVWVLFTVPTKREALIQEIGIAGKYGLPTITFAPVNGGKVLDKLALEEAWREVGNNVARGLQCLRDFNRLEEYPFNESDKWQLSVKRSTKIRACNLLPGIKMLRRYEERGSHPKKEDWVTVNSIIVRQVTKLPVYSLTIEEDHTYIADNITTFNCQAIYGFRGADTSSIDNIKREFGAVELPLTVSYRCPRSVVLEAQKFVSHIRASEKAPEGLVTGLDRYSSQMFTPADAILCRNTAPLVDLCFKLLRMKVGCKVLGREIGVGLIGLVKKMRAKTLDGLRDKLSAYGERETAKFLAQGKEEKADALNDRLATVFAFIENLDENSRTIPALVSSIESIFQENGQGLLTLCTVHKAKGLEWNKVYILDAQELMPSKWARQEWQQEQEKNLQYVAVTRSKMELYYITSKGLVS